MVGKVYSDFDGYGAPPGSRGRISVEVEGGSNTLRLRWRWARGDGGDGRRYALSLGLPDTPSGRLRAIEQAAIIYRDMAAKCFDPSLQAYRPNSPQVDTLTVSELITLYFDATLHTKNGMSRLIKGAQRWLVISRLIDKIAAQVDRKDAIALARMMERENLKISTMQSYFAALSAAWNWAIEEEIALDKNPWKNPGRIFKSTPKERINSFSPREVLRIFDALNQDARLSHYRDMVAFLFDSGCRSGEVRAVRWRDLAGSFESGEFHQVWISEAFSQGATRKGTKTGRPRWVGLSPALQKILRDRWAALDSALRDRWGNAIYSDPNEDLIFQNHQGGIISYTIWHHAWKQICDRAGVTYRPPRYTRHTRTTIALSQGCSPVLLAQQNGHDVSVLNRHYVAGVADGQIPSILALAAIAEPPQNAADKAGDPKQTT